jgi:hypothetical protein
MTMHQNMHEMFLNPAARAAVKAFRDAKPWRGTRDERGGKFAELHRGLCRAYHRETMLIRDDGDPDGSSGSSAFDGRKDRITLRGRLSVVTYLFCFAAATGVSRRAALRVAIDTFRHFFPRSFARCRVVNGLLVQS